MTFSRLTPAAGAATASARTPPAVVHVITGLEVGGAETALARLLSVTRSRGGRALVVTLRGGGALERDIRALGFPVVALRRGGARPADEPVGAAAIIRTCRSFQPDAFVGWMYHGIALAWVLRLTAARGRPLAWNVRCTLDGLALWPWSTQALVRLLRSASARADAIVYNSTRGRDQHGAFGFSNARAHVIDNGVDVVAFAPNAGIRDRVRAALSIPPAAIVVGHVARFDPLKDHQLFLEALLRMKVRGDVHVVMVGRGITRENTALAPLIRSVGSRVTLHALGERRDVADVMRAFDVFCLSSNSEGFPNVVVEAMACGLPCVVTDAGDAARIVAATGRSVPIGNVDALAQALEELCLMPIDERAALGRAAATRVRDLFSTDHMADEYSRLFAGLSSDP